MKKIEANRSVAQTSQMSAYAMHQEFLRGIHMTRVMCAQYSLLHIAVMSTLFGTLFAYLVE